MKKIDIEKLRVDEVPDKTATQLEMNRRIIINCASELIEKVNEMIDWINAQDEDYEKEMTAIKDAVDGG